MRKVLSVILGILMIVAGIYCLATPGLTFLTLGYVVGISMIIDGAGRIINWFQLRKETKISGWVLVSAILSLVLGIILIGNGAMQLAMDAFIGYMAIVWLVAIGIMRIVHAVKIKQVRNRIKDVKEDARFGRDWWIALILGILLIVCGVAGLFFPLAVAQTIGIMIGISIVIAGVNLIHFGTSAWMI